MFNPHDLLTLAFPTFVKSNTTFIPVFKYLRGAGIQTEEDLKTSAYEAAREVLKRIRERGYTVKGYQATYDTYWKGKTASQIISAVPPEKVSLFVPFVDRKDIELDRLQEFLQEHAKAKFRDPYRSYFKKLACYYDYLKYGFETH